MTVFFKEGLTKIELDNNDEIVLTLNGERFFAKRTGVSLVAIGSGIGEIPLVVKQLTGSGYTHYLKVRNENDQIGCILEGLVDEYIYIVRGTFIEALGVEPIVDYFLAPEQIEDGVIAEKVRVQVVLSEMELFNQLF